MTGKSIIIDAVGLLIGERASLEMIRYGEEKSLIQGVSELRIQLLLKSCKNSGLKLLKMN